VVSKIEPEAGELRELKPKPKVIETRDDGREGSILCRAKILRQKQGYQDGWASNQYRERFGVWPAGNARYFQPVPPSPETLSWIKSRLIFFAKSKGIVP
jgi:hypothetical protein